jgi:ABC-type lipoprotein export system ATPase subunit
MGTLAVEIKNYRGFSHREFKFAYPSYTLLKGDSGVGKSTLLSAIEFAFHDSKSNVYPKDSHTTHVTYVKITCTEPSFVIYRQKRPGLLTVSVDGQEYTDKQAQGWIDSYFSSKGLWEMTGYLKQGEMCKFLTAPALRKDEYIQEILYGDKEFMRQLSEKVTRGEKSSKAELQTAINKVEVAQQVFMQLYNKTPSNMRDKDPLSINEEDALVTTVKKLVLSVSILMQLDRSLSQSFMQAQMKEDMLARLVKDLGTTKEVVPGEVDELAHIKETLIRNIHIAKTTARDLEIAMKRKILQEELQSLDPEEPILSGVQVTRLQTLVGEFSENQRLVDQYDLNEVANVKYIQYLRYKEYIGMESLLVELTKKRNLHEQWNMCGRWIEQKQLAVEIIVQKKVQKDVVQYDTWLRYERYLKEKSNLDNLVANEPTQDPGTTDILVTELHDARLAASLLECPDCKAKLRYEPSSKSLTHVSTTTTRTEKQIQQDIVDLNFRRNQYETSQKAKIALARLVPVLFSVQIEDPKPLESPLHRIDVLEQRLDPNVLETEVPGYVDPGWSQKDRNDMYQATEFMKRAIKLPFTEEVPMVHTLQSVDHLRPRVQEVLNMEPDINLKTQYKRVGDSIRRKEIMKIMSSSKNLSNVADSNKTLDISLMEEELRIMSLQYIATNSNMLKRVSIQKEILAVQQDMIETSGEISVRLQDTKDKLLKEETCHNDTKVQLRKNSVLQELSTLRQEHTDAHTVMQTLYNTANSWAMVSQASVKAQGIVVDSIMGTINTTLHDILNDIFDQPISVVIRGMKQIKSTGEMKAKVNLDISYKGVSYTKVTDMSGGEAARVSIALMIAFSKVINNKKGILMLDEAMSTLDADSKEMVVETLKAHLPDKLVIFVNHDTTEGVYDATVQV